MMNKKMFSAAILLSIGAASMSVNAANINFTGTVTGQTCVLETTGGDLNFNLFTVGTPDVMDAGEQVGMMRLTAAVKCAEATKVGTVTMNLLPDPASFNGKVLKNIAETDAAKGVGFVVANEQNELLDFTKGFAEITTPMSATGTANIVLSAGYAKDGSGVAVAPGNVRAVLPFVLVYQ